MDIVNYALSNKIKKYVDESVGKVPEEKIIEAVNTYLNENPVVPGATSEQAEQIQNNTNKITELKGDISNKYAELGYQKIIVKTDELINSIPNRDTGIIGDDYWNGSRKHCKINVESYDTIKFTGRSHQAGCSWWYDASDSPISAVGAGPEYRGGEIKIPENAVWFRCPGTLSQWADETYSTFELFAHNNDSNIYNIKKKISEIDENVKQNTSDIESYESHFSDIERYENNNDVEKYNIGSWTISKKTGKTVILGTNDITKSIGIKLYGKSNNPSEPDENGLYNLCGVNIADSIKITLTDVKASNSSKSVSIPCTISELHGFKIDNVIYSSHGYTYIQDDEYYISDYVEINMDGSVVYVKNIGELVLTGEESSLNKSNLVRWNDLKKFRKINYFACNVSNEKINIDGTNGLRIPYTGDNFKESAKAMYEAGTPYIIYGVLKEPERIVLAENFNTNIKYNNYSLLGLKTSYNETIVSSNIDALMEVSYVEDREKYFLSMRKYNVVLPEVVKLAKGHNTSIYYEPLYEKSCRIPVETYIEGIRGMNIYQDQINGKPTESNVSKTATITSVMDNMKYYTTDMPYKVIDPNSKIKSELTALFVGDSFTEMGWWVDGIVENAILDGITLKTIGLATTPDGIADVVGQSGGNMQGFVVGSKNNCSKVRVSGITEVPARGSVYKINGTNYTVAGRHIVNGEGFIKLGGMLSENGTMTKVSGTGDNTINFEFVKLVQNNPFWDYDNNILSFSYFCNEWGFDEPDVLCYMFGWNDWQMTWNSNTGRIQEFANRFLEEYPDKHVIFVVPTYAPVQDTKNNYPSRIKSTRLMAFRELQNVYSENEHVDIVPGYLFVDPVLSISGKMETVNPRYETQVEIHNNIHCNKSGMKQISDGVYPYFLDLLMS